MKRFYNLLLLSTAAFCANFSLAQLGGNTCATAVSLTLNGACGSGTVVDATVTTDSYTCGGTITRETWYMFTSSSVQDVTVTGIGNNRNIAIQLLSGTCGALTQVACDNTTTTNGTDTETFTVASLAAGTYYVKVLNVGTNDLTLTSLCLTSTPPGPINDNCSGAIAFPTIPTDGTCANLTNQSTNSATNSNVTPSGACTSNSGTPDEDVWFSFVATTTSLNLNATYVSGNTDVYWQVLSGACSSTMNTLLCTDNNAGGLISGLTVGTTYRIRLYTWSSTGNTTQNICLSAPPPPPSNDECNTATALTVNSGTTCTTQTSGTFASATGSSQANGCWGTADDDLWYTFTATGPSHVVGINNATGSTTDVMYAVYSGSCASPGTALVCNEIYGSGSSTVTGLTAGNTYRVRVFSWSSSSQTATFDVCVTTPPPPPANDDCGAAVNLTVNPALTCATQTAGTIYSATASSQANACFGTSDDDVWYRFTATSTSHLISLNNVVGSTSDLYHAVYSGSCASPGTALVCSDPNNSTLTGLTVGSVYYVRVYSYTSTTGQTSTFDICVTTPPPPPSNDDCPGATAFPVIPTNGTCASLTNQNTMSATNSGVTPTGSCTSNFGTPDEDVWFSFVASATALNLTGTYVSGNTDVYWQVFSGACGSSMTSILCTDSDYGGSLTGLTVGSTYRIRLYTYSSVGSTVQNICLQTPPPPPTNDNCPGATTLTPSTGITCSTPTAGYVTSATASSQANGCFGTADDDVWYRFTASSTSHTVTLSNVTGSTTDMYHAVYSGTCASPGTALVCSDPNSSTITGLTVGNIYYVRVYTYTSTSGQTASFDICVSTPPPPPTNSNCAGMIQFCPTNPVTIAAVTGTTAQAGNNYGCLGSQPNPYWYYFTANAAGSLNLDLNAPSDVDFALWGPYTSTAAASAACGSYPAPIDCSYSTAGIESIDATATVGQVFVLLVTNYANVSQNISLAFDDPSSTGDCGCVPLPVEMSNFAASAFGKNTYVNWTTQSEKNNDYFLVQRSKDGIVWETLKMVDGHGNSTKQIDYQYVDEKPILGTSYYRLKQVDFDGVYKYSETSSVYRSSLGEHVIYPQPVMKEFRINGSVNSVSSIEIIDLVGKKSTVDFKQIDNEIVVNVEQFSAGVYVVNMISPFGIISEKIIIK